LCLPYLESTDHNLQKLEDIFVEVASEYAERGLDNTDGIFNYVIKRGEVADDVLYEAPDLFENEPVRVRALPRLETPAVL
jgi:hypothetical protein